MYLKVEDSAVFSGEGFETTSLDKNLQFFGKTIWKHPVQVKKKTSQPGIEPSPPRMAAYRWLHYLQPFLSRFKTTVSHNKHNWLLSCLTLSVGYVLVYFKTAPPEKYY
jgi:hypothetical protein